MNNRNNNNRHILVYTIRHLRILNNTPCVPLPSPPPQKILHGLSFFWGGGGGGANKVHYGRRENGEYSEIIGQFRVVL